MCVARMAAAALWVGLLSEAEEGVVPLGVGEVGEVSFSQVQNKTGAGHSDMSLCRLSLSRLLSDCKTHRLIDCRTYWVDDNWTYWIGRTDFACVRYSLLFPGQVWI